MSQKQVFCKERFDDSDKQNLGKVKKNREVITLRDLNSRTDTKIRDDIMRTLGENTKKRNGERIIDLCKQ